MTASAAGIAVETGTIYDAETLVDLERLFGRRRLLALLAGLRSEIEARLSDAAGDRERIGQDAHALVSTSGALGFMPLSQACVALERACLAGGDVSAPLALAREAGADAGRALDALCGARL